MLPPCVDAWNAIADTPFADITQRAGSTWAGSYFTPSSKPPPIWPWLKSWWRRLATDAEAWIDVTGPSCRYPSGLSKRHRPTRPQPRQIVRPIDGVGAASGDDTSAVGDSTASHRRSVVTDKGPSAEPGTPDCQRGQGAAIPRRRQNLVPDLLLLTGSQRFRRPNGRLFGGSNWRNSPRFQPQSGMGLPIVENSAYSTYPP